MITSHEPELVELKTFDYLVLLCLYNDMTGTDAIEAVASITGKYVQILDFYDAKWRLEGLGYLCNDQITPAGTKELWG